MKLIQYACINLDAKYQSKGDEPEVKNKWQLLKKEQCQSNYLNVVSEVIVGPSKLTKDNTANQLSEFQFSSAQLVYYQQSFVIANGKNLIQYANYLDLLSAEKGGNCRPTQTVQLTDEPITHLYCSQNTLILQTLKRILICGTKNSKFIKIKEIILPEALQQVTIRSNNLMLAFNSQCIVVNLTTYNETQTTTAFTCATIGLSGILGVQQDKQVMQILDNGTNQHINIDLSMFDIVKSIHQVGQMICVCGFIIQESYDDDEDITNYEGIVCWYQNNQIKDKTIISLKQPAFNSTQTNIGDYQICHINDITIVYGSNVDRLTFWLNGQLLDEFKNSESPLKVNLHSAIRGLCLASLSESLGMVMDGKYQAIKRNPTMIVLTKNNELAQYEFIDFDFKVIVNNYNNVRSIPYQSDNNQYLDDEVIMVESLQSEIDELQKAPFFVEVKTQSQGAQLIMSQGHINDLPALSFIQSANLFQEYGEFQIIGYGQSIIAINPLVLQQIFLKQHHQLLMFEICEKPNERILNLSTIDKYLLIGTSRHIYLVEYINQQFIKQNVGNVDDLMKLDVYGNYLLVQTKQQSTLYELNNKQLTTMTTHQCESSCLFGNQNRVVWLLLNKQKLYLSEDMITLQEITLDFEIECGEQYNVHQLYKNKIYIAVAQMSECEMIQKLVQLDIGTLSAQEKQQEVFKSSINDTVFMDRIDWCIKRMQVVQQGKGYYLVFIYSNYLQDGFAFQGYGDELIPILDKTSQPLYLPFNYNVVQGLSIMNYVMNYEKTLGVKPGVGIMIKDGQRHHLKFFPNLLQLEYDERGQQFTIHRYLLFSGQAGWDQNTYLLTAEASLIPAPEIPKPVKQKQLKATQVVQGTHLIQDYIATAKRQINGQSHHTFSARQAIYLNVDKINILKQDLLRLVTTYQSITKKENISSLAVSRFYSLQQCYQQIIKRQPIFKIQIAEQVKQQSKLVDLIQKYEWFTHFYLNAIQQKKNFISSTSAPIQRGFGLLTPNSRTNQYRDIATEDIKDIELHYLRMRKQPKSRAIKFDEEDVEDDCNTTNDTYRSDISEFVLRVQTTKQKPVRYYKLNQTVKPKESEVPAILKDIIETQLQYKQESSVTVPSQLISQLKSQSSKVVKIDIQDPSKNPSQQLSQGKDNNNQQKKEVKQKVEIQIPKEELRQQAPAPRVQASLARPEQPVSESRPAIGNPPKPNEQFAAPATGSMFSFNLGANARNAAPAAPLLSGWPSGQSEAPKQGLPRTSGGLLSRGIFDNVAQPSNDVDEDKVVQGKKTKQTTETSSTPLFSLSTQPKPQQPPEQPTLAQQFSLTSLFNAPSQGPATQKPPTQTPATQAPTTQVLTTQAPATQAPTTQAPTTQAPPKQASASTTQAPVTQPPATQAPATTQAPQTPTTQAPPTQAPTTQAPSTQAPTTQAPSTQAPSTQQPPVQPPVQQPAQPPVQAPGLLGIGTGTLQFGLAANNMTTPVKPNPEAQPSTLWGNNAMPTTTTATQNDTAPKMGTSLFSGQGQTLNFGQFPATQQSGFQMPQQQLSFGGLQNVGIGQSTQQLPIVSSSFGAQSSIFNQSQVQQPQQQLKFGASSSTQLGQSTSLNLGQNNQNFLGQQPQLQFNFGSAASQPRK